MQANYMSYLSFEEKNFGAFIFFNLKLNSRISACAQIYTIDNKNGNETLTKTLKYLHRNNTRKTAA